MLQERQRPQRNDDQPDVQSLGGGLEQTRASMDALLRAGDEAIRNALSGDSETFLRANRQHGGQ
jgi:hypothetical protein